jgi:hypothetical protein
VTAAVTFRDPIAKKIGATGSEVEQVIVLDPTKGMQGAHSVGAGLHPTQSPGNDKSLEGKYHTPHRNHRPGKPTLYPQMRPSISPINFGPYCPPDPE